MHGLFGLIVGGIVSKYVAIGCLKKINVHYPLLVASAYSGYVIWHMGYSSSAALFVASDNHTLIEKIGIIPVTETIFSALDLTTALLALSLIVILNPLMRPKKKNEILEIKIEKPIKKDKKKNSKVKLEALHNLLKIIGFSA